jgi:hypothetical protein
MKRKKGFFIIPVFIILLNFVATGIIANPLFLNFIQQPSTSSQAPMSNRQRAKAAWKKQREADRETKALLKQHVKNQTKQVRKTMRRNFRKAKKNNKNGEIGL